MSVSLALLSTACGLIAGVLLTLALQEHVYRRRKPPAAGLAMLPRPPAAADPRVVELFEDGAAFARDEHWEAAAYVAIRRGQYVYAFRRGDALHADARLFHALHALQRELEWSR
jgi:hypothetical protein